MGRPGRPPSPGGGGGLFGCAFGKPPSSAATPPMPCDGDGWEASDERSVERCAVGDEEVESLESTALAAAVAARPMPGRGAVTPGHAVGAALAGSDLLLVTGGTPRSRLAESGGRLRCSSALAAGDAALPPPAVDARASASFAAESLSSPDLQPPLPAPPVPPAPPAPAALAAPAALPLAAATGAPDVASARGAPRSHEPTVAGAAADADAGGGSCKWTASRSFPLPSILQTSAVPTCRRAESGAIAWNGNEHGCEASCKVPLPSNADHLRTVARSNAIRLSLAPSFCSDAESGRTRSALNPWLHDAIVKATAV